MFKFYAFIVFVFFASNHATAACTYVGVDDSTGKGCFYENGGSTGLICSDDFVPGRPGYESIVSTYGCTTAPSDCIGQWRVFAKSFLNDTAQDLDDGRLSHFESYEVICDGRVFSDINSFIVFGVRRCSKEFKSNPKQHCEVTKKSDVEAVYRFLQSLFE